MTGPGESMRISRAEVVEVAMPLREPFVTSFGPTASRHTILVRLTDDEGHVGWGEAAPLDHPFYLPDTVSAAFAVIVEYALPMCLRSGIRSGSDAALAMAPIRGNTFARAGVEAAFWALEAVRRGAALREMVGGIAARIPVGESIGIKPSIDAVLEEVELRLREGYRRIKLKIAPGWDVDVVRAVREALGDAVPLQVDANAAYTIEDAEHLARLDAFELLCIEQPLGYDDLLGHADLARRISTPVCLDESLRSLADVERALRIRACANVNLKPGRVGGVAESLRIHDLCAREGVPLWCGGMLESGVGRAVNIALCSLPGFTQAADMSPASVLYERDLVHPTYRVEPDGFIEVPSDAGLGFPVDENRVRQAAVRWVAVSPDGHTEVVRPRGGAARRERKAG